MSYLRLLFIATSINLCLYTLIFFGHSLVSFNTDNYLTSAHHYLPDPRITQSTNYSFLSSLAQFDSQWYLKIADSGYSPIHQTLSEKNVIDILSFAFFPLYPLLLKVTNLLLNNLLLSAFILGQILYFLDVFSLFYIISNLYDSRTAFRSVLLLFLFPFSIFFRSFFTESLQLFFLIWSIYFFITRRYSVSAIFMAFTQITKANLFLLPILLAIYLWKKFSSHLLLSIKYVFISYIFLPFWALYNYYISGSFLTFYHIQNAWRVSPYPGIVSHVALLIVQPIGLINYPHASKLDTVVFIVVIYLLYKSYKRISAPLWLTALTIMLTPLLFKDLISYSRHQSLSFPLFIYLSQHLSTHKYILLTIIFALGLGTVSLYFINWHWIG